jgi:hypothetical protein
MAESMLPGRLRASLQVVGVWLVPAALFLPQLMLLNGSKPQPDPPWAVLYTALVLFMLWAAMTPAILRLARRFPIERRYRLQRIGLHLLFGLVASLLHLAGMALLMLPLVSPGMPVERLLGGLRRRPLPSADPLQPGRQAGRHQRPEDQRADRVRRE